MAEIPLIQRVFCPRCETLIVTDAKCPTCDWERPDLNENAGVVLWKLALDGSFSKPYIVPAVFQHLLITVVERGGRSQDYYSRLVAIKQTSGDIEWSKDLGPGRISRFLVVADGRLLIGSESVLTLTRQSGKLLALDPISGETIWSYALKAHSMSAPAVIGDTLFFTASDKHGYALDLANGQLKWKVREISSSWTSSPPAAGDVAFYVGGRTSTVKQIGLDGTVSTLFRTDGDRDWFDFPLIYGDHVLYAGCWNKHLYAINLANGQLKWSARLGRGLTASPTIGRHVYVPFKETGQSTYSLGALDKTTGETVWQFNTDRHFLAPAASTEKLVFVGGNDGYLHALDANTGLAIWQIDSQDRLRTVPIVSGNMVGFGSRDGTQYVARWRREEPAELEPAERYRVRKEWVWAGTAAVLAGDWLSAAGDYKQAGEPYNAAQLYERVEAWSHAAPLYMQAADFGRAGQLYHQLGDKQGEAKALLRLRQHEKAAGLYSELGEHARAAIIYRDAGHLNRAATQFFKAGQFDQAADIYLRLNKLESAAEMYEKAGEEGRAVDTWLRLDKPRKAAGVMERRRRYAQAAELLAARGYTEDAAQIWLGQKAFDRAADVYENAKQWTKAAQLYERSNNRERAAELYIQAGNLQKAAKLYLAMLQFGKAADLFVQIQDAPSAAHAYEQQEDWRTAAQLYLSMKPPQYRDAGRCYEQLEAWEEAANAYERGKFLEDALRSWRAAKNIKRAALLLKEAGRPEDAAKLLEQEGELVEAAEYQLRHGNLNDAVRLYRLSGNDEYALELLAENEAWDEYRELAVELQQYERQAEACIALARQAPPSEAYRLYGAAAQAYERAASQHEQESTSHKSAKQIAQLWLLAARFYAKVDSSDERIKWCNRQALRLRGWPEIVIEVKAQQELVVGEWHRLLVAVKNNGFGYASDISLKVINHELEGDMQFTTDIVESLPPDETKQTIFSVKPKTAGSSVPMKISLTYQRPDNKRMERIISTDVPVRSTTTSPLTPGRLSARPLIDVYEDTGFQPDLYFQLSKKIDAHYNMPELHILIKYFSIDADNLRGSTRFELASELVEHMRRRNLVHLLIEKLVLDRPYGVDWSEGLKDQKWGNETQE